MSIRLKNQDYIIISSEELIVCLKFAHIPVKKKKKYILHSKAYFSHFDGTKKEIIKTDYRRSSVTGKLECLYVGLNSITLPISV